MKRSVLSTLLLAGATYYALVTPTFAETIPAEQQCEASWYGPGLQGNDMANGEKFDMNDVTVVAHKKYPFGTLLKVTNLNNNKTIIVEVQDRGPYIAGRCVDLSRAAAIKLGYYCGPRCGTAPVYVERIRS